MKPTVAMASWHSAELLSHVTNACNMPAAPAQVYAQPPYYSAYPQVATSLGSHMYAWSNMTVDSLTAAASTLDVVEISCAPNNPDASMQRKTIPGDFRNGNLASSAKPR